MLKLNIRFNSIKLSSDLVEPGDTIRMSITTIPDKQKQAKTFDFKDIDTATPSFLIKMNDCIQKILVVFRKKTFFSESPIIASTIIHRNEIGVFDNDVDSDYKKVTIYESAQNKTNQHRRIVGSMEVLYTLKEELQRVRCIVKQDDGKQYSSLKAYFDENQNENFF